MNGEFVSLVTNAGVQLQRAMGGRLTLLLLVPSFLLVLAPNRLSSTKLSLASVLYLLRNNESTLLQLLMCCFRWLRSLLLRTCTWESGRSLRWPQSQLSPCCTSMCASE
jgi:hypothetical protein